MEQLPPFGTTISAIVEPTTKLYGGLLSKNAEAIRGTMHSTHKYGPHSRQELDVYRPEDFSKHATAPVLMFVHGGGFTFGGKDGKDVLCAPEPGLVYANLGHYFAEKCGYITVVINYRLAPAHNAVFPTGGEDISLAVEWIGKHLAVPATSATDDTTTETPSRDLFIMGQSAGGVHSATWLLFPQFQDQLQSLLGDSKPLRLRGMILLSAPLHLKNMNPNRNDVLKTYFGDKPDAKSPLSLLVDYQKAHGKDWPLKGVQVLVVDCELDPEGEVRETTSDFLGQWLGGESQDMKDALSYRSVSGHNHLSPVWSVGTGLKPDEAWAEEISGFVDAIRRSEQMQRDVKVVQDSIKK